MIGFGTSYVDILSGESGDRMMVRHNIDLVESLKN